MSIWKGNPTVEELNKLAPGTMAEHLGMEFTEIGADSLKGKMPVDHRTVQPYKILHGGASVALAETLGSVASTLLLDRTKQQAVGLEINANHVRPVTKGFVYGTAKPLHIGGRTHIWEIRIEDELGKLVCISRLTTAIIERKI